MELKPTYQYLAKGNQLILDSWSLHTVRCLLDQILTSSSKSLTSRNLAHDEPNTVLLSIGDSATDLNFEQSDSKDISLFLCRSYFSHTSMPITDLEYLYDSLSPHGNIVIQEINFSEINSFPFNFAIGRFKKLYKDFCSVSDFNQNIGTSLSVKLVEAGFSEIERSYLPPIFLKASNRNLINYLFEYISDFALENNLIIEEEKIALSAEISNYLKNENNMISLPGVFQIKATKPI